MPPTVRMSREERRRHTRARLIEAACNVFAKEGFGGASVDRIAEEAGFTKGAFYSNFVSKEDIFVQILERGGMYKVDALAERLRGLKGAEALICATSAWAREQSQAADIHTVIFETIRRARLDECFGARYETLFHEQWLGIGRLLAPIFLPDDPPITTLKLGALVMELVYGTAMVCVHELEAGDPVGITLRALMGAGRPGTY